MKKFFGILTTACLLMLAAPAIANAAKVEARIDISQQRMYVKVNGVNKYTWAVSTGRAGYSTPTGSYRPQRLERDWHSRKYDWAPMPHSVFFYGGYAIHGTDAVGQLGRVASHGCVRLTRSNAATFFNLVARNGMGNTKIVVQR